MSDQANPNPTTATLDRMLERLGAQFESQYGPATMTEDELQLVEPRPEDIAGNDPASLHYVLRRRTVRLGDDREVAGRFLTRRIAEKAARLLTGQDIERSKPTQGRFYPHEVLKGHAHVHYQREGLEADLASDLNPRVAQLLAQVLDDEDAEAGVAAETAQGAWLREGDFKDFARDPLAQVVVRAVVDHFRQVGRGDEIESAGGRAGEGVREEIEQALEHAGGVFHYGTSFLDELAAGEDLPA